MSHVMDGETGEKLNYLPKIKQTVSGKIKMGVTYQVKVSEILILHSKWHIILPVL